MFFLIGDINKLFAQIEVFRTGYEGTTVAQDGSSNRYDFSGADWNGKAPDYPNLLGEIWVQVKLIDGDDDMSPSIVTDPDPTQSDNALMFQILNPNDDHGRVQTNIKFDDDYLYGEERYQDGPKNIHYTTRLYVPSDYQVILNQQGEEYDWLTISEFFNAELTEDIPGGNYWAGKAFRVSLNLHKDETGPFSDLFRFSIKGEARQAPETSWGTVDDWKFYSDLTLGGAGSGADFLFDSWLDLDVTFVEGDEGSGRFVLKINDTEVLNITANTKHTYTALGPEERHDGIHHYKPQKLYTAAETVNLFTSPPGMRLFWDDLVIEHPHSCRMIEDGAMDAEEQFEDDGGDADGDMFLDDADLDLGERYVGLQFTGFSIPPGAVITDAYVEFKSKNLEGEQPDDAPAKCVIYGEKYDNISTLAPLAFESTPDNISDRISASGNPTDKDVNWWMSWPWFAGERYRTANISGIITDIVESMPGSEATPDDVINIIFEPYDDPSLGKRQAYSFDHADLDKRLPPKLCISYTNMFGSVTSVCRRKKGTPDGISIEVLPTGNDPCEEGNYNTTTGSLGDGIFTADICGDVNEYEVTPEKSDQALCGLTMNDVFLLQNHIFSEVLLDDFPRIAADLNGSGLITNSDLLTLQAAVMNNTSFNKPWVFVNVESLDLSYDPNDLSALPSFEESIIADFPAIGRTADFHIVKRGDLDCSCRPEGKDPGPGPGSDWDVFYANNPVGQNEFVEIAFRPSKFVSLTAYQMGIRFDAEKLEFVEVLNSDLDNATDPNKILLTQANNGSLIMGWTHEVNALSTTEVTTLPDSSTVFILRFKATENIPDLSNVISLNEDVMPNLVFGTIEGEQKINLIPISNWAFGKSADNTSESKLLKSLDCFPNPVQGQVNFRLRMEKEVKVNIQLFNSKGEKRIEKGEELGKGISVVSFEEIKDWTAGLYYYTIKIDDSVFTGKFIKTDNP